MTNVKSVQIPTLPRRLNNTILLNEIIKYREIVMQMKITQNLIKELEDDKKKCRNDQNCIEMLDNQINGNLRDLRDLETIIKKFRPNGFGKSRKRSHKRSCKRIHKRSHKLRKSRSRRSHKLRKSRRSRKRSKR